MRGRRQTLVVIIPGNPGEAIFYEEFRVALAERGHEVVVSSHPMLLEPPRDLRAYAGHHAEATLRHLASTGRTASEVDIVLVGHSVGSYLAYLIVAHGLLPVARVFMLFPFLTRPSLSGRLVLAAFASPAFVRGALAIFRALPARTRRWLVVRAGGGEHVQPALEILESERALACAVMSAGERAEIASRRAGTYLFEHRLFSDRQTFVPMFCAGDRWSPSALADELAGFAYHFRDGVTHAFVVDGAQRRAVVEVVHQFLAATN